jgi:hypothetical protein
MRVVASRDTQWGAAIEGLAVVIGWVLRSVVARAIGWGLLVSSGSGMGAAFSCARSGGGRCDVSCWCRVLLGRCGCSEAGRASGAFVGSDVRPAGAPPLVQEAGSGVVSVGVDERDERFWVALSEGQVRDLVQREAVSRGGGGGLLGVVLALDGVGERIGMEELVRDERYHSSKISHSAIHCLAVLGAFALGDVYGVKSLAGELGMSPSTTWRYLKTGLVLGVLEEREDRRYQLAERWMGELSRTTRRRLADGAS